MNRNKQKCLAFHAQAPLALPWYVRDYGYIGHHIRIWIAFSCSAILLHIITTSTTTTTSEHLCPYCCCVRLAGWRTWQHGINVLPCLRFSLSIGNLSELLIGSVLVTFETFVSWSKESIISLDDRVLFILNSSGESWQDSVCPSMVETVRTRVLNKISTCGPFFL